MINLPMKIVFNVAIGNVSILHGCHGASDGVPKNCSQCGSIDTGSMKD